MYNDPRNWRRFERYSPAWWTAIEWWRYKRPRLVFTRFPTFVLVELWDGAPMRDVLPAPYIGQTTRVIYSFTVPVPWRK